jgi:hypothetical protein
MTRPIAFAVAVALLTGCATKPLSVRRPSGMPHVPRLCDVAVTAGTDLYLELDDGATARGRLDRLTCEVVELVPPATRRVVIKTDEIALAGRVKGRSSTARGWIGAAIGAAVVAPFGISMTGDMVVLGAVAGGLIGRNSGNSHVDVVFERTRSNGGRPSPIVPLPAQ